MGFPNIPDNEVEVIPYHLTEIFIITDMGGLQHFQMGVIFAGAIPFNDFMPDGIDKGVEVLNLHGGNPIHINLNVRKKLDKVLMGGKFAQQTVVNPTAFQKCYHVSTEEYLPVYPLNFREFLAATASEQLLALLRTKDWPSITAFSAQLTERLKQYYFVGGMPEAVMTFRDTGDLRAAQEVQKQILLAYEKDFSKHAPSEIVPRIRAIWNSIPSQLSKENRKFIYGALQKSARAKDYGIALQWLVDCGLVYQVHCLATIQYPIKSVAEREVFKLFALDVGLLCAMTEMSPKTFIEGNALMTNFKGALTEQYVCQQLISATPYGIPHYWSSSSGTAEVDFVIQKDDQIIPIEVKAEENLKSKSLKVYSEKFKPTTVIRTSLSNYREESWMVNWPLYAVGEL